MSSRIFDILGAGWNLHLPTADPIIWHGRDFNKIADFLVNYTMDRREDWHQDLLIPSTRHETWKTNLLCHSDGGTREGSCSAAAWIIEAVGVEGHFLRRYPLAMRGIFMLDPISSFTAESIALEDALTHLSHMMAEIQPPARKRPRR